MSTAANSNDRSNDRAATSPFAEMLDSTAAAEAPASSKTPKSEKKAATGLEKSAPTDAPSAKLDAEPLPVGPVRKQADPALPTAEVEANPGAAIDPLEKEPEVGRDTVAEAVAAEPDADAVDLTTLLDMVGVATRPEAEAVPTDKTKPADAVDVGVPAEPKAVVKVHASIDAVALPVAEAGDATRPAAEAAAISAGDTRLKAAPRLASPETTAAASATAAAEPDALATAADGPDEVIPAPVPAPEKTATRQKAAGAGRLEARPVTVEAQPAKPDTNGAKADPALHAPAPEATKAAAPAHRAANARHGEAAEAKPAPAGTTADAAAPAKAPDLPPPSQPPVQPGPSSSASIHAVTLQKDPAAPASAVPIEGVAVEIVGKALEGKSHFEIRLDPPELGRIHVQLDVDRNGEITSRVMADRQDTLDLLRREAPQLERALSDAGLRTAGNGLQFSLRDQGHGHHEQQQPLAPAARLVISDESLAGEPMPHGYYRPAGPAGGLDIRV